MHKLLYIKTACAGFTVGRDERLIYDVLIMFVVVLPHGVLRVASPQAPNGPVSFRTKAIYKKVSQYKSYLFLAHMKSMLLVHEY